MIDGSAEVRELPGVDALMELALDLHWAWNHVTDDLWAQLDPEIWAATHNPLVVLQTISRTKLAAFLDQPANRQRVDQLLEHRRVHRAVVPWFEQHYSGAPLTQVAYFSMEFALSEALPIYSGGLGNVAGDQLKAACDLGIPAVGIGLLYQQGYFRQRIRTDGSQEALFPYNDPGQLPISPVRDASGEWLRVEVTLPGYSIRVRIWQAQVDRRTLYLLDSNDPANPPEARSITGELYGGGPELRLQQELVLGIGGWRLLRALGLEPEICHLNEGHPALAVLERARCFALDNGCPFDVAFTATRAGNVFTTHTAVPAGFDRYTPALFERYLGRFAEDGLGITCHQLLALGRENPEDSGESFNMAYLALRGSGAINGVSRLHGAVSRRLFQPLFPRWPEREVPIEYVTNGIHVPTWDSAASDALWTAACGEERWGGAMERVEPHLRQVADVDLWTLRCDNRKAFVNFVRERMPTALAAAGAAHAQIDRAREMLDPEALTVGIARRFATYKRPTLLLHSPERLIGILADLDRPVQIVVAGKAHPADVAGQALIADWVRFSQRPEVEGRVIFIPDYDLLLAERLVQGVDLWINTPRRPWEACGTSGMKILVNGGLNLSALDGWWAEAYTPEVGWAIGDGREHGDDPDWDAAEANDLYAVLEREVIPAFYTRDGHGVATAWVGMMRESMAKLTPQFSSNRAVREYTELFYLPAAAAYRKRSADNGVLAARLLAWQRHLAAHWSEARVGTVKVDTREGWHHFTLSVELGGLDVDSIRVELFADSEDGGESLRHATTPGRNLGGTSDIYECTVSVPASRPVGDYTARLVPHHADARIPLEAGQILWQR